MTLSHWYSIEYSSDGVMEIPARSKTVKDLFTEFVDNGFSNVLDYTSDRIFVGTRRENTWAPFHKEVFSAKMVFERQNGFSATKILLMGFSVKIPIS